MESLSGKLAVVTGGTRGIGRAIAERLLGEDAAVAICGRSNQSVETALAALRPLGPVIGMACDVTQPDQVSSFFAAVDREFGGLDILVNNAGKGVFGKVADLTPEQWRANIELNLNGPFYCSREALARFRKRGGGFIVNISSLAGKNPFSGGAGYNASKFGLNGFSEAMMLDHRYDNVRVATIMPGSVDTGFSGGPSDRSGDTSWMIAPEDVAEAVAMVLRMPARTMISRIEMRPARPKK
ncbi:MAG: SDR family oxidoreductase [Bryobacteraceae bacterium]|jgi:NAD(P)-dependent dehydrogenase (short-subunit alcohol dehydrogenase family)